MIITIRADKNNHVENTSVSMDEKAATGSEVMEVAVNGTIGLIASILSKSEISDTDKAVFISELSDGIKKALMKEIFEDKCKHTYMSECENTIC